MLVIDQNKQPKVILAITILDYNKKTIFGIEPDGKRTWLGKYDQDRHAQIVYRDIEKAKNTGQEIYTMP